MAQLVFYIVVPPCITCVQYRGGYHEYCGGYLEYRGILSTVGDVMMHVGISCTMGAVQYRGKINLLLFEYPTVLDTPRYS